MFSGEGCFALQAGGREAGTTLEGMILPSVSGSGLAISLAAAAAVAYTLPAAAARRLSYRAALWILLAAWVLHGVVVSLGLAGEVPRFGWASAVSVTGWMVLTIYLVERDLFPLLHARWALAALGVVSLLLPLLDPGMPLRATGSGWQPVHLALGMAAYGLFAAAVLHAWLMRRAEQQIRVAASPQTGVPLLTLERLTFRFVGAGFVLLSSTLLAGLLFSETLHGQPWRWDHKTVLSVLAWAAFATLLVGRARFGWRGRVAVRVLYAGAVLLLLAYAGSRFVLEVVLGRGA